jgi:hypothetical protein
MSYDIAPSVSGSDPVAYWHKVRQVPFQQLQLFTDLRALLSCAELVQPSRSQLDPWWMTRAASATQKYGAIS